MQKWHFALIGLTVVVLVFLLGDAGTKRAWESGQGTPVASPVPADRLITLAAGRDASAALSAYHALEQLGQCPYLGDSPETPIGMLTAAYDMPGSDAEQVLATIRLLLQLGCDINQYSGAGLTPLHNAVLFRQPALLRFLLVQGADPKLRVIPIPGRDSGRRIAHLDAYGMAQSLHDKMPDDTGLQEILELLKPPE